MATPLNLGPAPVPEGYDDEGAALWTRLAPFGQQALLKWWPTLSADERAALKADIDNVDLEKLQTWFSRTQDSPAVRSHQQLKPVPDELVADSTAIQPTTESLEWEESGFDLIGRSKVSVLLMAGGQGTRLGSTNPKGMFPLGLDSGATLFEIQAKRILRLQNLAKAKTGQACIITWYIMTSSTFDDTLKFLQDNNYWGLDASNVILFKQNQIPCLLSNGKMLLNKKNAIARSPDGNGGLYSSMVKQGVLADMEKRGIEYIHIYGVDNILCKVADPRFLGFCKQSGVEVGAKCVVKKEPTEKVGLICMMGDQYEVMEYSEITPDAMALRRGDGGLVFSAANIVQHLYTIDFLKLSCAKEDTLKHHVANKKLPFVNDAGELVKPTAENGVKLEKFVFDVFRFAKKLAVVQVSRESDFAPLKNASAAGKDCVETCRAALYALHRGYLKAAGAVFVDADGNTIPDDALNETHVCEIDALATYSGEGLAKYVEANPKMTFPINITA